MTDLGCESSDELRPFEQVLEQVSCYNTQYKKDGVLVVTSCRVMWKPLTEATYPFQIERQPNSIRVQRKEQSGKGYWVLNIIKKSEGKRNLFRLLGPSAEQESQRVEKILKKDQTQQSATSGSAQDQLLCLEKEDLEKLMMLKDDPQLQDQFKNLLVNPSKHVSSCSEVSNYDQDAVKWTEQDFWSVYENGSQSEQQQKSLQQKERKKSSQAYQNAQQELKLNEKHITSALPGVKNKPIMFERKQNIRTSQIAYTLSEQDCQRLLTEYPKLKQAYETKVNQENFEQQQSEYLRIMGERRPGLANAQNDNLISKDQRWVSKKQFWTQFFEQNVTYQTEPFGGTHPIFIPYHTDEKDYEDKYIHNQQQLLNAAEYRSKEQTAMIIDQAQKLPDDVNFIKNNAQDQLPSGYGTLQKDNEIDTLVMKETCNTDAELNKQLKKDQEMTVQASKVIVKFNTNSSRVIQNNKYERKLQKQDFIDEEFIQNNPQGLLPNKRQKIEKEQTSFQESLQPKVKQQDAVMENLESKTQQVNEKKKQNWDQLCSKFETITNSNDLNKPPTEDQQQKQSENMRALNRCLFQEAHTTQRYLEYNQNIELFKKDSQVSEWQLKKFQNNCKKMNVLLGKFYSVLGQVPREQSATDHTLMLLKSQISQEATAMQKEIQQSTTCQQLRNIYNNAYTHQYSTFSEKAKHIRRIQQPAQNQQHQIKVQI